MTIQQDTFLGASIVNFQSSIGWGRSPSSLTVLLVEDATNGDDFSPTIVGAPVYFDFNGWAFGGILQSWTENKDESGNPLFRVSITDPRELLEGVQLILDGYNGGTFGVPNLYNIYGYLESTFGFGGAQTNETGIPWRLVKNAFSALQASTYIQFRGYQYTVNISAIPDSLLPEYYRVPGENISLLGFIEDICDASGCDFFVTLFPGEYITINLISRRSAPSFGQISSFIASQDEINASEAGIELRNEITSKFLVGGQVEEIYYQTQSEGQEDIYTDDTIWPYWGVNIQGDVIVGEYSPASQFHKMKLDATAIRYDLPYVMEYDNSGQPTGVPYNTNIAELRAALGGQDTWETFLVTQNNRQTNDQVSADYAQFDSVAEVPSHPNPHYNKATQLGLVSKLEKTFSDALAEGDEASLESILSKTTVALASNIAEEFYGNLDNTSFDSHRGKIRRIYEWVLGIAQEYYGKKYMVRVPFVLGKIESETNNVVLSRSPLNSGFLDESAWPTAISLGLLPLDVDKFSDADNKIQAYVRYNNFTTDNFDISELDTGNYTIWGTNLFIKCDVDENLVFLDKQTLLNPRAVITLSIPVFSKEDERRISMGLFTQILNGFINNTVYNKIVELVESPGGDFLTGDYAGHAIMPNIAAVPLRNNILTYGPWYASGSSGKTEFQQDSSLVPWNYGGFTQMNLVGNSKVQEAFTNQQAGETGSITFPGIPSIPLGSVLVESGPYVTDVNVTIGEQGATTTYKMQTWTQRFGRMGKFNEERFKKLNLMAQKYRKDIRNLLIEHDPRRVVFSAAYKKMYGKSSHDEHRSSSHVVFGSYVEDSGTNTFRSNVAFAPLSDMRYQLKRSYEKKALGTLDTLFRPFSTDPDEDKLPHYETPKANATLPTVSGLDPFYAPHDFSYTIRGTGIPENGIGHPDGGSTDDKHRLVGFRNPLVLVGWGYDTNGKPVPNASSGVPGDEFLENYKRRMDRWKAGPLDVRWDDDRKVWITGTSGPRFLEASLSGSLCGGLLNVPISASGRLLPTLSNIEITPGSVVNPQKHRGSSGDNVLLIEYNNTVTPVKWAVFNVEKKEVVNIIGIEDTENCLRAWGLKQAAEWCGSDESITAKTIITYVDCLGSGLGDCSTSVSFDPLYME